MEVTFSFGLIAKAADTEGHLTSVVVPAVYLLTFVRAFYGTVNAVFIPFC